MNMKTKLRIGTLDIVLATVAMLSFAGNVSATVIADLYGDKDGFGVGIAPGASFTGFYPSLSKFIQKRRRRYWNNH